MGNLILILIVYIPAFFFNGKNRAINILLNCLLAITPLIVVAPIIMTYITDEIVWHWFVLLTAPIGGVMALIVIIIKLVIFLKYRASKKKLNSKSNLLY